MVDGAFGVELGGEVGAADQAQADAGGAQFDFELAARFLPGADDDSTGRQQGSPLRIRCRPASSMRS